MPLHLSMKVVAISLLVAITSGTGCNGSDDGGLVPTPRATGSKRIQDLEVGDCLVEPYQSDGRATTAACEEGAARVIAISTFDAGTGMPKQNLAEAMLLDACEPNYDRPTMMRQVLNPDPAQWAALADHNPCMTPVRPDGAG